MNNATLAKLDRLIANYVNGNLKDAARQLRGLTKFEVASLLVEGWHCQSAGDLLIGNPDATHSFEQWVVRILSGWSE